MSFIAKTDPFSLSGAGKFLALVSVTDGKSASVAEARNENGDVVATTMYGVQYSPAYEYRVAGSGNVAIPSLGSVVTTTMADDTSVKLIVTGWALNTAAGSENTFSLNAESVPSGVTAICPYVCDCGSVAVGPCMHAKSLFSAFTLGGTGCHLQSANYAGACDLGRARRALHLEAKRVQAHDVARRDVETLRAESLDVCHGHARDHSVSYVLGAAAARYLVSVAVQVG